jgi:hypothetical protein
MRRASKTLARRNSFDEWPGIGKRSPPKENFK